MASICIRNGNVILKDDILKGAAVCIKGSKIEAIHSRRGRLNVPYGIVVDAKGCFVSPGFIDCHIHGEPKKIFSRETRFGTTSIMIAESCAPLAEIYKNLEKIKGFAKGAGPLGRNVLGVHLEGPYINKRRRGAQAGAYIKRPDPKELLTIVNRSGDLLKVMTIAPELSGADLLIRLLKKKRIIASIGHSDATHEEASRGIALGIRHATHLFNAMSGVDRRDPGAVGAVLLDSRVTAEIILDLVHVHKSLFKLLIKLKGADKVILITDSVRAASDRRRATMKGGAYRFKNGVIAGSSLTMVDAVKNAVETGGIAIVDAIKLATLNPAMLLGVERRKGSLSAGKDADIVIFDKQFDVKMTIANGEVVYRKRL